MTMLRRPAVLLAFGLLAAVLFAWVDAWRRSYALQFLTPAGHLQAVGSDRTGLVFFFSDIPFGREVGLADPGTHREIEEFLRAMRRAVKNPAALDHLLALPQY